MSPAARKKQREYRRRLKRGEIVLKVTVRNCELAEALINAGRLCSAESADRAAVERQVALILSEWCDFWHR